MKKKLARMACFFVFLVGLLWCSGFVWRIIQTEGEVFRVITTYRYTAGMGWSGWDNRTFILAEKDSRDREGPIFTFEVGTEDPGDYFTVRFGRVIPLRGSIVTSYKNNR